MSSLYGNSEETTNFLLLFVAVSLKLLALWKLRPYYSLLIFSVLANRSRVLGMLKYSAPDL